jgi:hypothetical protein
MNFGPFQGLSVQCERKLSIKTADLFCPALAPNNGVMGQKIQ